MKLAFSTNAYTRHGLFEAMRSIRDAGFEGVEILADVPHAWPGDLTPARAREVLAELGRLNLACGNVNANCSFGYWKDAPPEPYFEPSLISPNPRHREDRRKLIVKVLDFASAIGAGSISITSGRLLGGMPPERAAIQFAESIAPILDHADKVNVNVGIECEPGLYVEYIAELREWIDRLNHPRLGANLDIGHSVVIGESVPEVINLMRGRIWNIHVEDLPGRKHYHMIPGEGTFDWPLLRRSLVDIAYDRFVTVELYTHTERPEEAAIKSAAFLKRLFGD